MVGGVLVITFVTVAALAPWLVPYKEATRISLAISLEAPSLNHPLGTDELGRSLLARTIWGARISLVIAVASVAIGTGAGVLIGLLAGYFHGFLSSATMRAVDALIAFPRILLALILINALGTGLWTLTLAIGISTVPIFARLVRGSTLAVKEREFIDAARAIGQREGWILYRHILPNIVSPVIVQATLSSAAAILIASGLSFLGLGPQPPTPEWGTMISAARSHMRTSPHVMLVPGLALMIVVLGFNLFGDGLRDILDPRLKGRH